MIDGIKIINLLVDAVALLALDHLPFGARVDTRTGAILNPIQKAIDQGLTFTIVPTKADQNRYRVELAGSLHRYGRGGVHNADDFTATDLRAAVESLTRTYGINASRSTLNNLEFGVNLQLPFPVADLLRSLICHRGVPFTQHKENGFHYYQAERQQYVVKVYDKGTQFGLAGQVLRFEIKVLRMHYLHRQGIGINVLSDLLNSTHYSALGRLLVEVFQGILFDELLVDKTDVPTHCRELLIEGRNPRNWQVPTSLIGSAYNRQQKKLKRDETRFKNLLATHRPGRDWQGETAALLSEKWLTLTHSEGLTNPVIKEYAPGTVAPLCPKLTGVEGASETGDLSDFNATYKRVISDRQISVNPRTVVVGSQRCLITNIDISHQRGAKRFVGVSTLRQLYDTDRITYDQLASQYLTAKQAKASFEKQLYHVAHNIRNTYTNTHNNPIRRLRKYGPISEGQTLPLFPLADTIQPTDRQLAALQHRQGTRWELPLFVF